ncbi:hypothetical protein [Dysosmobacter sp.]|uniref:hypothetical protein n=1 Tax=Dysosmobacter sp. TaxID=2591382 RepID=UPI003AF13B7E
MSSELCRLWPDSSAGGNFAFSYVADIPTSELGYAALAQELGVQIGYHGGLCCGPVGDICHALLAVGAERFVNLIG